MVEQDREKRKQWLDVMNDNGLEVGSLDLHTHTLLSIACNDRCSWVGPQFRIKSYCCDGTNYYSSGITELMQCSTIT